MISPFRKANTIVKQIDNFFDVIDNSMLFFINGVKAYLSDDAVEFEENISKVRLSEKNADTLLKDIEHILYKYSLLPELRTDVMRLIQRFDDVVDVMKEVLVQFDVEQPRVPADLHAQLEQLTVVCIEANKEAILSAKVFFHSQDMAKKHIEKTHEYEHIADDLAENIKRRIFHEMDTMSLSEKFHIRDFTYNIENLSDIAQSTVKTLNLLLIKRFE